MFGKENYISPRNSQQYFYKISLVTMIQVPNKVMDDISIYFAVKCHCTRAVLQCHVLICTTHVHCAAKSCLSEKDGSYLEVKVW